MSRRYQSVSIDELLSLSPLCSVRRCHAAGHAAADGRGLRRAGAGRAAGGRSGGRDADKSARSPSRRISARGAKRVIMLFMDGGPSHHDLFDYKPLLVRDHGQPLPFKLPRVLSNADRFGNLLGPLAKFQQRGAKRRVDQRPVAAPRRRRRRAVRDPLDALLQPAARRRLPGVAHGQRHVRAAEHGLLAHLRPGQREPEPARLHHASASRWPPAASGMYGSAFLPAAYQGTPLGYGQDARGQGQDSASSTANTPTRSCSGWSWSCCAQMGGSTCGKRAPDSDWRRGSTPSSWRSACRPRRPQVQDISGESAATHELYGLDDPKTAELRPAVPAGPALRRARRALRAVQPGGLGPSLQHPQRPARQCLADGQAHRRPDPGPARLAGCWTTRW